MAKVSPASRVMAVSSEGVAPGGELVALSHLVVSDRLQVRSRTDPRLVRQYARDMRNGAQFPPLKAVRLNGTLVLIDGFHRWEAMRENNIPHANVEIAEAASEAEARWRAAEANLCHGAPLKTRELRGAFNAYVRAGKHRLARRKGQFKSYRDIAAEFGGRVPHSTVYTWMRKDFPSVAQAMGGGDDAPRARGGLPPSRNPETFLAREASAAFDKLDVVTAGIGKPQTRYALWERAKGLVQRLEAAGIEEPDF